MTLSEPVKIPMVLTSKDPSFSGLFENACHASAFHLQTTAGPAITLETVRSNSPALVLIDTDSVDAIEASRLVLKLTLVTDCCIVITGTDAIPGLPSMDVFLHSGAHGLLSKPEGKTSLCLSGESGGVFLASLNEIYQAFVRGRRQ